MGYSSLFVHAAQCLKLPEAVAYNAIAVMRKAEEIPELKQSIASGPISQALARRTDIPAGIAHAVRIRRSAGSAAGLSCITFSP